MYEVLKALHLIAVIAWMAGLLYLPRIMVYHAKTAYGSETDVIFQTMETRLYRYIMTPAMLAVWILGLWLTLSFTGFNQVWLHAKLALVVLLSAFQGFLGFQVKAFRSGTNKKSSNFYRYINELPTVTLIIIVFLVILKPF